MPSTPHSFALQRPFLTALALSLGAAVSLGLTRFSYALLLPPMRGDLDWSYLLAGAMNTGNALGYLLGALFTPALMRRFGAQKTLIGGCLLAAVFMLWSGFAIDTALLMAQRILAGIASAFVFVAGGVLAARLGSLHPGRTGLLIGLYYGGVGIGIALSALLVPLTLTAAHGANAAHAWQWAWLVLGALCLLATALLAGPAGSIDGVATENRGSAGAGFRIGPFRYALAGYFMFGVGYIGYMTFIIALLKSQGMGTPMTTLFFTALGLAVVASSRIWAGMLDRYRGGESLAILNALLGVAILLPALTALPLISFISGLLFGAVFLSLVASTTALVRHNLPPHAWSAGISVFTIVFAFGQIVGPAIVGWIADGAGGLQRGFLYSSAALFAGALLAWRQQPLPQVQPELQRQ
jgi:predicted MFS family arabinose efflux permease